MMNIDEFKKSPIYNKRMDFRLRDFEVKNLIDGFVKQIPLRETWIKTGADKDMICFAELLGFFLAPHSKDDNGALTNSQIRNVFGEIKRIQMSGFENNKADFYILKPKVAYAAGRHKKLGILAFKAYFDKAFFYVEEERDFQNFCNLLEAILAYHKAYGGKD